MSGSLEIRQAKDGKARKRFLDLPFRLYRNDPHWVPPLRSAQAKLFAQKTAFFQNADMALFLAERDGKPVARIAAIHNKAHNRQHEDRMGFFGFFESEDDDVEAVKGLVAAAEGWLAERQLDTLRGPVNPSMNAECGILLEGFDRAPVALMPYNPPSYPRLLEAADLKKCKDMFAYLVTQAAAGPGTPTFDRILKTVKYLKRRHPEIQLRTIDLKHYKDEILRFMGVFEEARRNNWGYVPVTHEEVLETAKDLRMIADAEIIIIAEVNGEVAGSALAIPDINQILAKINGRLFPFGFIKFLTARKHIKGMRIFGIGALEKYRHLGITALLLFETARRAADRGYDYCEASWVLEDNIMSNRTIERVLKPDRYKTYRLYEKPITR
ncbi:MAG: hypothetical protein ACYTHM_13150 [Planctomycetota bacterium]|jgi:GNAT superfamily N-acetyltransferase